jgi:hypothetical protein
MPTYRNNSRGTVIIKNVDGVPCPVGPKEIIATFEEINLPGLSLVDPNPKPEPEAKPESEPKKLPEIEPEPEPVIEPEPEPEPEAKPEPVSEPEPEKAKWYKKIFRRKQDANIQK